MNDLEAALRRVGEDLDHLGRPWALVGALAVSAHAEARATLDVDVVMAVDDPRDAEEVISGLLERGYKWHASFGAAMSSLVVPSGPPAGLRLDLLFSLAGIEPEVARKAERMEVLENLVLPVATLGHLAALKLLAAREPEREHDLRDLRALVSEMGEQDLVEAKEAIALLVARGQAVEGQLETDLDRLRTIAST